MTDKRPQIDLICNVVARRGDGRVLLVRYDPEDKRWWLPGRDLVPYEHPQGRRPRRKARRLPRNRVLPRAHGLARHVQLPRRRHGGAPREDPPRRRTAQWEKEVIRRAMEG